MSENPRCCKISCPNPGRWQPILLLAPSCNPYAHDRARVSIELGLTICDDHKAEIEADPVPGSHFICDQGWTQITKAFAILAITSPDRESARVRFRALTQNR